MLHLGCVARVGLVYRINVIENVVKKDLVNFEHFPHHSAQVHRKRTVVTIARSERRAQDHENVCMAGNGIWDCIPAQGTNK